MDVNCRAVMLALLLLLVCLGEAAHGLVGIRGSGTWPKDWPHELEPLRNSAKTLDIATGTQETIYEISFDRREVFESVWPAILSVKSKGAPITLYSVNSPLPKGLSGLLNNAAPIVRIYAPAQGGAAIVKGKELPTGPPWPESILAAAGVLPEYVQAEEKDGRARWVPAQPGREGGHFLNRARVDLDLVVDGKVIDLNRIPLPPDTPIIDRRVSGDGH